MNVMIILTMITIDKGNILKAVHLHHKHLIGQDHDFAPLDTQYIGHPH